MVKHITLWLCFVHVSSPSKCSPSDYQNVARQWMDLQIVDFPSDLCGFSQLCWIPIAGRWWQVLKWMPSEHSMPKYGDVALNNGMFSYANCWSNHHFFLIWICSTMIHPENRLNRFFLEHLVVENDSQVSIVTRGLLSWWVACCERASSCQRAPRNVEI